MGENLSSMINTDNDTLKYEYIEIVKNGLVNQFLQNQVLSDSEAKPEFLKKTYMNQARINNQIKKIQEKYYSEVATARSLSELQKVPNPRVMVKLLRSKYQSRFKMRERANIPQILEQMKIPTQAQTMAQKIEKIKLAAQIREQKISQAQVNKLKLLQQLFDRGETLKNKW